MLRYFVVFNADQVEGYKRKVIETKVIDDWKAHFKTDSFVENIKLQKAKVDTTQQLIENILEQEPEEEISKPKDVKKGLMSKEKEDDK